jgi:hypothetical protein
MEEALNQLNNTISRKQRIPLKIITSSSEYNFKFDNEINLKEENDYKIGLYYFDGTNGIFNISAAKQNNRFNYYNGTIWKIMGIPDGGYEISQLNSRIQEIMKANGDYTAPSTYYIEIGVDIPTLRTYITLSNNYAIDFNAGLSFENILGFNKIVLNTQGKTYSQNAANITDVDSINLTCNITSGFYVNGKITNLLFSYPIPVPIGYTFRIIPPSINYLPVRIKRFNEITFKLVNDDGIPIDFNGYKMKYVIFIEQV